MRVIMSAAQIYNKDRPDEYDVVIVGAGFSGLYALYHVRKKGFSVQAYDDGDDVGGTWYWNRYPGARVDNESVEYSFSFSEEVEQEWSWSERYASQPELLRYFDFVATKYDLRRDFQFRTRVESIIFDTSVNRWSVNTNHGDTVLSRFVILATGILSAPKRLDFPGLDSFGGQQYYTSRWPHEKVDFSGQRVGIIGTGSSGVQVIPHIAKVADHLTVFQRTPSYAVPACNRPVDAKFQREIKAKYAELRRRESLAFQGGIIKNDEITFGLPQTSALAVSSEEREAEYERCWNSANFTLYWSFDDVLTDKAANETVAEFVRAKIRAKINDPAVAELLIPTEYAIMTKRLCAEIGYYETFNRKNVNLVSVKHTPIEAITRRGVQVAGHEYELDSLIFATGFDAMTGAVTSIDIEGRNGRRIREEWGKFGPRTHLGLMSNGFPNLFYISGPSSPAALFAPIMLAEFQTRWIVERMQDMSDDDKRTLEPTAAAEDMWIERSKEAADRTLLPQTDSWYMGANIPGKPRVIQAYMGGFVSYQRLCADAIANHYQDFE